ncbi:response regulator [Sulfurimonas aquatica]|uniref:Sensory/regulatory protein RpfC n=1 Tax=Sulfurimonas aquatica TaxID=2672570 RepID=A0A975B1N0_9BACT|nr:response regulator [Sulfurimonas aquatica]QSZ42465.1 response regulator [Sulfurimonas aquatica]
MKDLILIVEDSKTIAMYQKTLIESLLVTVIVAQDMSEVKEITSQSKEKVTLAIVDINLPDCGDCVLDYLLKLNIPCIAMTGSFHPMLREKVINKKLVDYIVLNDDKNLELLQSTVKRILNNKNTKILIVDDSKSSRYALKDLLEHQNYTALEAKDGVEALRMLRENDNVKIALVDYEMPGMNGAELTREIRKHYSRTEVSILAISIHSEPIITIEFLKAGANDFITKPYIKEEVIARIGVNVDMIDQNVALQKEVAIRHRIEKDLEEKNRHLKVLNKKLLVSEEEANKASVSKSDFLANMSHEIRTPMNAILGFIDLLFKDETSKEKLKKLNIIKESGYSLLTIINDILDFSKIESGKLHMEQKAFYTKSLFNLVTDLLEEKALKKNIKIVVDMDDELPKVAYGDTTRIKQVYANLLGNAIKFSGHLSQVDVKVSFLKEKNLLVCSVKDHGVGIAEENLERIFNAFEQEDNTTTRKFGGTGLGLSISKTLMNMMGGDLEVKSVLGKGSEFIMSVDVFSNANEELEIEEATKENKIELLGSVLLVEDNLSNQILMEILLNESGLDVIIANNGAEAVEAYKLGSYSVILMDENMPVMNGSEATKEIRRLEKLRDVPRTPIIAVTANAFAEDKQRFLDIGMDDYISKPIERQSLEQVLCKHISCGKAKH